jgi:hypothetical protein
MVVASRRRRSPRPFRPLPLPRPFGGRRGAFPLSHAPLSISLGAPSRAPSSRDQRRRARAPEREAGACLRAGPRTRAACSLDKQQLLLLLLLLPSCLE